MVGLRNANPYNPQVILSINGKDMAMVERKLHREFKEKRIDGEWFSLSDEDIEFIKREYGIKQ